MTEITDADREAWLHYDGWTPDCAFWAEVMSGKHDDTAGIHAFAAQRELGRIEGAMVADQQAFKQRMKKAQGAEEPGSVVAGYIANAIRALDAEQIAKGEG